MKLAQWAGLRGGARTGRGLRGGARTGGVSQG